MHSRPPGTSALRTLRSAATGLAKNIVPKRENAMSNSPSRPSSGSHTSKRRLSMPASSASSRAVSTNRGDGVDPEHLAFRAHQAGEPLRGVAEPAADVHHPVAGLRRLRPQGHLAVPAQPFEQHVPELHEAIEQDTVPGLDRLVVGGGGVRLAHVRILSREGAPV